MNVIFKILLSLILLLYLLLELFFYFFPLCGMDQIKRIELDRFAEVVSYRYGCGAGSGYSYNVTIKYKFFPLFNDIGNIVSTTDETVDVKYDPKHSTVYVFTQVKVVDIKDSKYLGYEIVGKLK